LCLHRRQAQRTRKHGHRQSHHRSDRRHHRRHHLRRLHPALPASVLHLCRSDTRHALRPHRPLHLRRRQPHPHRNAPPHPGHCPRRLPTGHRIPLGLARRRRRGRARPHLPHVPTQLLKQSLPNTVISTEAVHSLIVSSA